MSFDPHTPPCGSCYLFHYTESADARQIQEDGVYMVRKWGKYGPGLYVTDITPDHDYNEWVLDVCFDGDPPEILDGVVVFLDSDPPTFFDRLQPAIYKRDGSVWEDLDLEDLVIATGCFVDGAWEWAVSEY